MSLFPTASVMTEKARGSDHTPLVISLDGQLLSSNRRRRKIFRFEAMWTRNASCREVISRTWDRTWTGAAGERLQCKLRNVCEELDTWEKTNFGSVNKQIKEYETALQDLDGNGLSTASLSRRAEFREKLDELLAREEVMWKQRGKAEWLHEGDLNTTFFHARANARQCKNAISCLRNLDGSWSNSADEVQKIITDYFQVLFNSSKPSNEDIEAAIEGLPVRVSTEMNEQLLLPFTADEVKSALFQMYPYKSPGTDASKAIANRLKPFLTSVISETQSAFLPGRLITYNVLVAYEINHYLAHKYWGSTGHAVLKLDLSKAYDRVE
ncbi:UNVERIFIED_CONTAM: hypothetical protein Slati_1024600 [Sesamum latifolium]|uniref:Reverse transcriptase n=1 Tax=Sesamum latifolium TaxID=2727402 RepID=A0AAW2XUR6_9LAMI